MVIVVGSTHHNTLSIIRCLGHEGIQLDVILCGSNNQNSYVAKSCYINQLHVVADVDEAISTLNSHYSNFLYKPVLILCTDDVTAKLDEKYNEYSQSFLFFNAGENGRVTKYMDKQIQVQLASKVGFRIPKSVTCMISNKLPEFNVYPCIIKPLESIRGGKRFYVCNSEKELESKSNNFSVGDVVQIQEYIKRDYEIVVDGLALPNKDVLIPGYIEKFRDLLGGTTYSLTHPVSELPKIVVNSIIKMVREIGYIGLFGVELIVSKDTYFFIEINLRNDATTYSLVKAGVNLPFVYVKAMEGKDYSTDYNLPVKSIRSIVEFRDFDFVLKGKISWIDWKKQLKECECRFFYDDDDKMPYRMAKKQYLMAKISTLLKKLYIIR